MVWRFLLMGSLLAAAATAAQAGPEAPARGNAGRPLGLTLTLSDAGATVVSVESEEVREIGVQEGDVITDAGGRPVRTAADLEAAIAAARQRRGRPVLLRIRHRDGSAAFVAVPVQN